MLKSHKNHKDDWLPFLLTASCEGPPTTPYRLYTSRSRGMVKYHNHFKIGIIIDPELPHYRSGKSKSILVDVQNPCLQPPEVHHACAFTIFFYA